MSFGLAICYLSDEWITCMNSVHWTVNDAKLITAILSPFKLSICLLMCITKYNEHVAIQNNSSESEMPDYLFVMQMRKWQSQGKGDYWNVFWVLDQCIHTNNCSCMWYDHSCETQITNGWLKWQFLLFSIVYEHTWAS